jgi:mannose-6-phosphate isomerase
MGAHPSAPSKVERSGAEATLDAVIAANPTAELGTEVATRFGGRLPFLLKVLAAQTALSIQVHPSREQAEAGFNEENARGLKPGDKGRTYQDDWPKPEILCALTPFEYLAGMRTIADAAAMLRALDVPALEPLIAKLDAAADPSVLTTTLTAILSWPDSGSADGTDSGSVGESGPGRAELVAAVVAGCERLANGTGPYAAACAATVRIAGEHPGDLGVIASLLLNYGCLKPGQAIFLPAGGLHAYLRGTGVELLANSDNVARAGLTPKHIDVQELLKLTAPAVAVPVIEPRSLGGGIEVYDSPAPEFRLYRADLGAGEVSLPGSGPRVVLCAEGTAVLRAGGVALKVAKGESCYLSAADGGVTVSGPASAFIASTGI